MRRKVPRKPAAALPPPPSPAVATGAAIAAVGAAAMAMNYTAAALIAALAERGAIDPARVFELVDVLIAGFDTNVTAAPPAGALTAQMLRALRPTFNNLIKIPEGAGRA